MSISRLILGGNLIGGWAHSRDLAYVSKLFKEYKARPVSPASFCNTAVNPMIWW